VRAASGCVSALARCASWSAGIWAAVVMAERRSVKTAILPGHPPKGGKATPTGKVSSVKRQAPRRGHRLTLPESFTMTTSLYDIPLNTLRGQPTTLAPYRGQVLLIVNVASQCGLTPQYAGLETLFARYRDRGLQVLGFPCNDFASQEPGSAEEIQSFCTASYGVRFPLFEKTQINSEPR